MDAQRATRISRYLARHLRHEPERIGITLDPQGWTPIAALLAASAADGFSFTREELEEVVAANEKQRYAIDGDRVRANQGHSVPVDLGLPPTEPPPVLFHGTVARSLAAIRTEGLRAMTRHAVHLSADRETAGRVGARRGKAVVLTVDAGAMHRAGHTFHVSENGVWLVERVPAEYVRFPAK
jgi:putative RNA 2'-phosphotransferase